MKKLLLIATMAFIGSFGANAQCTPDPTLTGSGIFPDSATNFVGGCVGQQYTQIIQNVVPADTTVPVLGFPVPATIDSIVLTNVTGLPPGLTYACNPNSCAFLGGETGCAVIQGVCNTAGTYNLVFDLTAYVTLQGLPHSQDFTLDYYKIVIGTCTAGIEDNTASLFQMFPNPTNDKVIIEGLNVANNVVLTNAEGKVVKTFETIEGASLELNLEGMNSGLYFVTINHTKGTEVLKLVKN
jgi:hypothetical protein